MPPSSDVSPNRDPDTVSTPPASAGLPVVQKKVHKELYIGFGITMCIFLCGVALAFAPNAIKSSIFSALGGQYVSDDTIASTITFNTPREGEEFYEGGIVTITFDSALSSEEISRKEYNFSLLLKKVGSEEGVEIISHYQILASIGDHKGTLTWHIPTHMIGEFGSTTSEEYELEMVISRVTRIAYTQEEIDAMGEPYTQPRSLGGPPMKSVVTILGSTKAPGSFRIYKTRDSLVESESGYFVPQGQAVLGKGNVLDLWGGRFSLRLDALEGETAQMSLLQDKEVTGTLELKMGVRQSFSISGKDETQNATLSFIFSGTVVLEKTFGPNLGQFLIIADPNMPKESSQVISSPKKTSYAAPTVTTGLATMAVAAKSSEPFAAVFSGQYNLSKWCEPLHYILDYGDGTTEKFVTNGTCAPVSYNKTHRYAAGIYSVSILLYAVEDNNWTYFTQASALVTVAANGAITIRVLSV